MENVQNTQVQDLYDMANVLRIHTIEMCSSAGSGHITSCTSIAEIMSALFFHPDGMHYDPTNPKFYQNDVFVLSKGHAAPILYAAWAEAGYLDKNSLLDLRKITSDLDGHPMPKLQFVDVATGSLGQGMGNAIGMAYSSKYLDKLDNRYFVIMGDGETAEGSVWEACNFASTYKLNNLITIVDCNKYAQTTTSFHQHDLKSFQKKFEAFGMKVHICDGHSIEEIIQAFQIARASEEEPVVILAKTIKGKGCPEQVEDNMGYHGKNFSSHQDAISTLAQSIKNKNLKLVPVMPGFLTDPQQPSSYKQVKIAQPDYQLRSQKAIRNGIGKGLAKLGDQSKNIIVLDADCKKSTSTYIFEDAHPNQFVECFIAEQNMLSVATGLSCRGKIAFASTFGAFLTRAFDQIRIAGISNSNLKILGSHAGISIGPDGPSQMGLEDIAMMRSIPNATILYPSDMVSAEKCVELAANTQGIVYVRTTRGEVPVSYQNDEQFEIGKFKELKSSSEDQICLIGAGVTLHESIKAAEILEQSGIKARVVDLYCIQPIDKDALYNTVKQSGGKVYVVEDHYEQGGIKDTINKLFINDKDIKVCGKSITGIPRSGKTQELFELFGIDFKTIANDVKNILTQN